MKYANAGVSGLPSSWAGSGSRPSTPSCELAVSREASVMVSSWPARPAVAVAVAAGGGAREPSGAEEERREWPDFLPERPVSSPYVDSAEAALMMLALEEGAPGSARDPARVIAWEAAAEKARRSS